MYQTAHCHCAKIGSRLKKCGAVTKVTAVVTGYKTNIKNEFDFYIQEQLKICARHVWRKL